jgi:hypothetical protein
MTLEIEDNIIDIEPAEIIDIDEETTIVSRPDTSVTGRNAYRTYLILPAIFLAVTLLGGLRLGAADNTFVFLRPALACLVFAAMILVLYFRSGLIAMDGWLSDELSGIQNAANLLVLVALFAATVQLLEQPVCRACGKTRLPEPNGGIRPGVCDQVPGTRQPYRDG